MHEVLNAEDVVLAEVLLDDLVVGEGDALLVDLAVSALVDQLADGLEVGLAVYNISAASLHDLGCDAPVCDVWLNKTEHVLGGLGHLHENTVVDLEEAEELKDFAGLWRDLVNTAWMLAKSIEIQRGHAPPDTDNKVHLRLCWDVEVTRGAGSTLQTDLLLLRGDVLLHILLGALEDDLSLGLGCLLNKSQTRIRMLRVSDQESLWLARTNS